MHVVQSALYRGEMFAGMGLTGAQGSPGDAFSKIFGSTLDGLMGKAGIQDALKQLQERFPGIKISEGDTAAGAEDAKNGKATGNVDEAAVSSSVLAGMFGNSDLAKIIEDTISGLLERSSDSNLMNIEGAYVYRSVSITLTQVRYGEYHNDASTGELLGGIDLKANFQEQLSELIKKFFGGIGASADAEGTGEDGTEAEAAAETEKTGDKQSQNGSGVTMWSLDIYMSFTAISGSMSGTGASAGGQGQLSGWQSWQYSSFSASLRGMLSNALPSALQGAQGQRDYASSDTWKSLEDLFASHGLSIGGLTQTQDGFMARLREGRNLLAELMELYGGRLNKPAETYETDSSEEVGATEVAQEEAVEAVGAV